MTSRSHARTAAVRGELEQSVEVAPRVSVTWDPARPDRCVDVNLPAGRVADVDRLPWLRLAAVIVLDQQLYVPLDRSLLDAEMAAARLAAADTLQADDPIREDLLRGALVGARAASQGVVRYVDRLAAAGGRPPGALGAALAGIARSYVALSREVQGFDAALAAVINAWNRLGGLERTGAAATCGSATPIPAEPAGEAHIDPRAVPARVLRLGRTTDTAEIRVESVPDQGGSAVRVRVDAFHGVPPLAVDVAVRLIDRRTGTIRGHGLLGQAIGGQGNHFEGLVRLPSALSPPDVRVDVYGVTGAEPPSPADAGELLRVRRATIFLSDWRALVADVRLWGARVAAPTARLRAIMRRLTGEDAIEGPLWSGGPTWSNLMHLVEMGDRALSGWLDGSRRPRAADIPGDDGGAAVVLTAVSGQGDLLAAELAAAHKVPR